MAADAAGFAGGAATDEGRRADGAEYFWVDDDFSAAGGFLLASGIAGECAVGCGGSVVQYSAAAGGQPGGGGNGGATLCAALDFAEFSGVLHAFGGCGDCAGDGAGAGGVE